MQQLLRQERGDNRRRGKDENHLNGNLATHVPVECRRFFIIIVITIVIYGQPFVKFVINSLALEMTLLYH